MNDNMKIFEEEPRVKKGNPMGIVSLVLSGIGLVGSWIPLLNLISMILAASGIVVGIISIIMVCLKKAGMVVLPILAVIFGLLTFLFGTSVNTAVFDQNKKSTVTSSSSSSTVSPQEKSSQSSNNVTPQENNSQDSSNNSQSNTNDNKEYREYKVGDKVSWDGKEITVTNVDRNYKPEHSEAKDGKEFIKVTIEVLNKSDKDKTLSSMDFKIQDSTGAKEYESGYTYLLSDQLKSATLTPGGSRKGAILFEVKKDDKDVKLVCSSSDIFSSDTLEIKL